MLKHVITVHGINTFTQTYAEELNERLMALPDITVRNMYWGDIVKHYIDKDARKYNRKRNQWWSLRSLYMRKIINASQKSMQYCLLYLQPHVRKAIIDQFKTIVEEELHNGDRFVFVGHSLGSVVVHDALTEIQAETSLLDHGRCHGIVTMGSPISSFPHTNPANISVSKAWYNIMDKDDPIALPISPDRPDVQDITVNTGNLFSAHNGYWGSKKVFRLIEGLLNDDI